MSSRVLLVGALVALLVGTGCTSFEMTRLRNGIERDVPEADIGSGYALSFGRFTMGTARTVLAFSDDDDEGTNVARALLRHVKKVQLGRYHVHGRADLSQVSTPGILDRYERGGWLPFVTVRDDDELVWILAKEKRDDLRDLLVVVLSSEELVVAKLSGNLTRAVTAAMAETDWARQVATSLRDAPSPDSLASATPLDDLVP